MAEVVEEEDPGFHLDLQSDLLLHQEVHPRVDLQLELVDHIMNRHLLSAGQFPQQNPSMF